MNVESAEVALAYTYAWWLTGDEHAARAAVIAAVDRPDVPGADDALRTEILLRRVRAAAVTTPTMCPASELALLHDALGVGLDSAAGLAMIDAREARTELAHGRLEALGADAEFEIVQPERLGGLAVGNPADVAAARQNSELGRLREMILKGRDELVALSDVELPPDLLAVVAARQGDALVPAERMEPEWFTPLTDAADVPEAPEEPPGGDDEPQAPEPPPADPAEEEGEGDEGHHEEIDLRTQVTDPDAPEDAPARRRRWLIGAVVLIPLAVVAALVLTGGDEPTAEVEPTTDPAAVADVAESATDAPPVAGDPDAPVDATAEPGAGPGPVASGGETSPPPGSEPAGTPGPTVAPGTFRVGAIIGIGNDVPILEPVTIEPFDPISFALITADPPGEPMDLVSRWLVDGAQTFSEDVGYGGDRTHQTFTRVVPLDGWPVGEYVVEVVDVAADEVIGSYAFSVVPEGSQGS